MRRALVCSMLIHCLALAVAGAVMGDARARIIEVKPHIVAVRLHESPGASGAVTPDAPGGLSAKTMAPVAHARNYELPQPDAPARGTVPAMPRVSGAGFTPIQGADRKARVLVARAVGPGPAPSVEPDTRLPRTASAPAARAAEADPDQSIAHDSRPRAAPEGEARQRARYDAEIRLAVEGALRYPPLARKRGWQGTSVVGFYIDRTGRPGMIELRRSSGFGVLDTESLQMVERAAPYPPLDGWVEVPVTFRLRK